MVALALGGFQRLGAACLPPAPLAAQMDDATRTLTAERGLAGALAISEGGQTYIRNSGGTSATAPVWAELMAATPITRFPQSSHSDYGHPLDRQGLRAGVARGWPGADRDAFIAAYRTGLYHAHGALMKEYVAVTASLLARTAELAPYLAKSYDYAKSLRPKPTSRQR